MAALVAAAVAAAATSASPPQNAALFNEVGGLPTISSPASTASCPTCGVDQPNAGETLTASPGTWSQAPPPSSFAYQWRRCALDGTKCVDIAGATSSTYRLVAADVTHVLVVTVTARNTDGSGTATSVPTGIVASANAPAPTALPTLTGLVIVGKQLSLAPGVWLPKAASFSVLWQRCALDSSTTLGSGVTVTAIGAAQGCLDVTGATGMTYNVTKADIAHRVRAVVTATTSTGDSASAISNTSSITLNPKSKAAQQAAATGTATVTVTAGKPSEFSFNLSTVSFGAGKVVFKVTNRGKLPHNFEICSSSKGGTANACAGKMTPLLTPGKSAKLTVTLAQGTHEFLCTVRGHAAAGMKGAITVGPKGTPAVAKPSTGSSGSGSGSPGSGTTGPPAATETLKGDPAAGRTVFTTASPSCASCHILAAVGSTATTGPNLDSLAPSQADVVNAVTYGLPGGMPAFGQTGALTATQINNVAAFVYASTHR